MREAQGLCDERVATNSALFAVLLDKQMSVAWMK
jgi:hypothetical protein